MNEVLYLLLINGKLSFKILNHFFYFTKKFVKKLTPLIGHQKANGIRSSEKLGVTTDGFDYATVVEVAATLWF